MDISWFMRIINGGIARMANREDDSTERFWEGYFSSLALLDEKALADSLTNSDHTSIKRRCEQAAKAEQPNEPLQQASGLVGCIPSPITLGAIPESTSKIFQQLKIDPKYWCYLSQNFESQFNLLVSTSCT
jgi:hypothetical protein